MMNLMKFGKFVKDNPMIAAIASCLFGIGITETGKCSRTFSEEKTKRINKERECKADVDKTRAWTDSFRFSTEQYNTTERYRMDKKNERQQKRLDFWDKQAGRVENTCDKVLRR